MKLQIYCYTCTEVEVFLGEEVRAQTAGANTSGGATKNAIFHARPYPLIYTSEYLELLPGAELISAK